MNRAQRHVCAATSALAGRRAHRRGPTARAAHPNGAPAMRQRRQALGAKSVLNAVRFIKTAEVIELSRVLHVGMPISRNAALSAAAVQCSSGCALG